MVFEARPAIAPRVVTEVPLPNLHTSTLADCLSFVSTWGDLLPFVAAWMDMGVRCRYAYSTTLHVAHRTTTLGLARNLLFSKSSKKQEPGQNSTELVDTQWHRYVHCDIMETVATTQASYPRSTHSLGPLGKAMRPKAVALAPKTQCVESVCSQTGA